MTAYTAPLRDMRYVLYDLHDGDSLFSLPGLDGLGREDVDMVLEQAARLCQEVLAPLNRSGDEQGCRLDGTAVTTPDGFREAFAVYRAGGWPSLACAPEHGGQGLPLTVQTLFDEMLCAANLAFTSYPGLTIGGYGALAAHGAPALKDLYLPRLADGSWTATMCLTEPQCGTDLSLVRTRAIPAGDDTYRVQGTKIFITAGEHDLTENIIHLVLARLPDAPPGIKGLSLFLVPKFLPDASGAPGERNAVFCGAIEHKMGLKGSATCVMNFDGAAGWLVGTPHQGLRAMFAMMNIARLAVAMQGVGIAEAARQKALTYARERVQGVPPAAAPGEAAAQPIIRHPDVKRMLLTQTAYVQGMRALAVWIGLALDRRERAAEAADRQAAEDFIALMTPVAKALCTDLGFECATLGVQVMGGHGYIREHGMEQLLRDARIGQLYEGTNGVQALDLVTRKISGPEGERRLATLFAPLDAFIAAHQGREGMADLVASLAHAAALLCDATRALNRADPQTVAAGATEYLRLFGLVVLGFLWARMAAVSLDREDPFHRAKVATARFYLTHLLTPCDALARSLSAGAAALTAFPEELLQ